VYVLFTKWILDIQVYPRVLYHHFLLAVFGSRRDDDEEEIEKEDRTESDSGRHQATNPSSTYAICIFVLLPEMIKFYFHPF